MANRRVTNARRAAESRRDGARQAARTARTYRLSESRRAALRIIALALIIILLIIIAASSFRQASIASQGGGSGSFWSHLGPGKGYPYDLDSSTVDAVGVLDGALDLRYQSVDVVAGGVGGGDGLFGRVDGALGGIADSVYLSDDVLVVVCFP